MSKHSETSTEVNPTPTPQVEDKVNNVDEAIAVTEHLLKVLHVIKIDGQAQPQKLLDLRKGVAFGCLQSIADVLDGGSLPGELAQMLLPRPN